MKELYTPQEVSEILDVHVKTVRRYLRDGTLIGEKIGGSWKIPASELQKQISIVIPKEFEPMEGLAVGKGKIRNCLIIEIDVESQIEANKYAQALMEIMNNSNFDDSKFKYYYEGKVAKFILNGPRLYINSMLEAIEVVSGYEEK